MKQCIICGQSIREGSHICPTCGFRAELPFFLSAAQYEQWMKACAVPYREQWDEIHQGEQRRRSAEEKVNQLLQEAEQVKEDARQEAEQVKEDAQKEAERILQAARREAEQKYPEEEETGLQKFSLILLAVGAALMLFVFFLSRITGNGSDLAVSDVKSSLETVMSNEDSERGEDGALTESDADEKEGAVMETELSSDPVIEITEASKREITFESTTVIDNKYCKLTVNSLKPNGENDFYGTYDTYKLYVTIENTSDIDWRLDLIGTYANGLMIDNGYVDGSPYKEIAAGETQNCTFELDHLMGPAISEYNNEDITDLRITVYITSDAKKLMLKTFHIYPYGEKNATVYKRESQETDKVLVDNEYMTMTLVGTSQINGDDFLIHMFVQNKSDDAYWFGLSEDAVNGSEIGFGRQCYGRGTGNNYGIQPGTCCYRYYSISADKLDELGMEIQDIETADFVVTAAPYVFDSDGYLNEGSSLFEQSVSLTFE